MGDDDAAGGDLRRDLGQAVGDVLVAEAVEAVAADALVVEGARQRVAVGVGRMVAVEGGVEAGDLRHLRGRSPSRGGSARGCSAGAAARATGSARAGRGWPRRSAPDGRTPGRRGRRGGRWREARSLRASRARRGSRRSPSGRSWHLGRLVAAVDERGAGAVGGAQARPDADAVDLAAHAPLEVAAGDREDLELQARRAGVDDEDRVHVRRRRRRSSCGGRRRRSPRPRRRRGGCGRCRRAR